MYYRDASAAVLICDRTNPASLENLKEWLNELDSKVDISQMVIAVAINKCDLPDKQISEEDMAELKEITDFICFETSAKTGAGVMELFTEVAKKLH